MVSRSLGHTKNGAPTIGSAVRKAAGRLSLRPVAALGAARFGQTPAAHLNRAAPGIRCGARALGNGCLTILLDELLLQLAPHDSHVDDHGNQVHVQQNHHRDRQLRRDGGDENRAEQHDERNRDEELAEVAARVDVVADVHAPRQPFGLRHAVDVAGAHRLILFVLALADPLLRGLGAGLAVRRHQRTQVTRLRLLHLGGRTAFPDGLGGRFLFDRLLGLVLLERVPCHNPSEYGHASTLESRANRLQWQLI